MATSRAEKKRSVRPVLLGYTKNLFPVFDDSTKREKDAIVFVNVRAQSSDRTAVRKSLVPPGAKEALNGIPESLRPTVSAIVADPALNRGVMETMGRAQDFSTPVAAMLAGIYLDRDARERFDTDLDDMWAKNTALPSAAQNEVVVGAGVHAAIYAAVRVLKGFPPPLILEARDRVGGSFAVTRREAFFLNSRNRPGPLSIPGEMGSLNFMPGALVQPSELGGAEYQTNDALAWVVRSTLAMFGKVIPNAPVARLSGNSLLLPDGRSVAARRTVWATGLGVPVNPTGMTNERILMFDEFMRRLDGPYPLRGMDRVAVVGGGDGARTVIEALTGKGPGRGYSVAALDWPSKIDWYGAPFLNCADWIAGNRNRYKPIGSLLPDLSRPERPFRVKPMPTAQVYGVGFDCVYVGEQPYDYMILACGYTPGVAPVPLAGSVNFLLAGRTVAKQTGSSFVVGPAAFLPVSPGENEVLNGISENSTSIFRYAPRTAALASALPAR